MMRKTSLLPGDVVVPIRHFSLARNQYVSTKIFKNREFDRYVHDGARATTIGTLRLPDVALVVGSFRRRSRRGEPNLKTKLMVMTKFGCGWVNGDNVTRV